MPRRDPLALDVQNHSPTPPDAAVGPTPPSPLDLIPRPRRKRRRDWERRNPARRYLVPPELHSRARAVREAMLGLAQQYHTTASDVARALMTAALAAVEEGEFQLDYRPRSHGRRMTVEVVQGGGWPQKELPSPKPREKAPSVNLTYRWGPEVHQAISNLAGDAPQGAIVVLLLEAALARLRAGEWGLRPRPVAVKQEVVVSASRKSER